MDRLTGPLQESILAMLATDDAHGRIAAGLLTPEIFDESYQDFAARILRHIKQHGKVPGKAHLDDLCDDILDNPKHKKHAHYVNIISGVLSLADSGLNADYLLSRVTEFNRRQTLKSAVLRMAERYQQDDSEMIADVEAIMHHALRQRPEANNSGVFLHDIKQALTFLDHPIRAYKTGIDAFDRRNVGPTPGEMLLFVAPTGKGKSWWCVDTAKRCLMQGAKVVFISLEMPVAEVVQRIFQNFFALTKRREPFNVAEFAFDRKGQLKGAETVERTAKMTLNNARIKSWLESRITKWGVRFSNLVVHDFPANYMDTGKLESYLDALELTHSFVPHVLIIDYPDKMKLNRNDLRLSLAAAYTELSGLLKARNLAGVFPTQTNRRGWSAGTVTAGMVGEDAHKIMIANKAIIFSRTVEEESRGLARLYVSKNRGDEDGFTVVITQSYASGQFMLESTRMDNYNKYREMMGLNEASEDDNE